MVKMKIRFVTKRILKDYAGMNHYAAKEMHFKPVPPKNTIFVDKNMSRKDKVETVKHEIAECNLMKKGMHYFPAHKKALKAENKK